MGAAETRFLHPMSDKGKLISDNLPEDVPYPTFTSLTTRVSTLFNEQDKKRTGLKVGDPELMLLLQTEKRYKYLNDIRAILSRHIEYHSHAGELVTEGALDRVSIEFAPEILEWRRNVYQIMMNQQEKTAKTNPSD